MAGRRTVGTRTTRMRAALALWGGAAAFLAAGMGVGPAGTEMFTLVRAEAEADAGAEAEAEAEVEVEVDAAAGAGTEDVEAEDELVDLADFEPISVLGADLACSACELTLSTLAKNYLREESAVRKELQAEQAALEAEKEAKEKETSADSDDKDEDGGDETTDDTDEKSDAEAKDEEDSTEEESDGKAEKKKKKKSKKDSKKKKKKKKTKKKKPEVKVDAKVVVERVMESACNASDFASVSVEGKYPGRRYSPYGSSRYGSLSLDSLNSADGKKKNLVHACKKMVAGEEDFLRKKLASVNKSHKSMKKIRKDFCEKRQKMCKNAALGFEAESACLAKSLRAMTAGEFDKALKIASKCPTVTRASV